MTVFLIPSFFILHSLFFPTPARAEITCPDGGVVQDSSVPEEWQCCNYASSPNHIPQPDPEGRCNEDHCKRETFPGSFPYGGECKYCNPLVTVRKDGCSGCGCTCNQSCAGAPPPPEECPLPEHETDPCCPLELDISSTSIPEELIGAILNAKIVFREDELRHAYVEELKLRHYGQEGGREGAMRKLMPPNHFFIQDEAERQRVDNEWGAWGLKTEGGGEGVMGADPFFFQLNYATDFLGRALTPPIQEGTQTFSTKKSEELCNSAPISIDLTNALAGLPDQEEVQGAVLAAEDEELCHKILPGPKHGACVAQDSVDISIGEAVEGVFGRIKLFPSFSFLRNIFTRTLGSGAEGEPAGYFRIFDLPGEEHENLDGETEKGRFEIRFSISVLGVDIPIPIGIPINSEMEGIWNTGTEAEADKGIQLKLTIPQAENGETTYRAPEIRTASVRPAPRVLGTTTYPQNQSLAEHVGHTLGRWLAKLITL